MLPYSNKEMSQPQIVGPKEFSDLKIEHGRPPLGIESEWPGEEAKRAKPED